MPHNESTINRRSALVALLFGMLAVSAGEARADDGGDGGGDGGGGDGGGDGGGGDGGGGDGGGGKGDGDNDDSSKVRDAVRNGNASSLKEILAVVREQFDGEVVRIRVNGSGERLTYNIRILDRQNRLIDIRVNAKSRRITGPKVSFY